MSSPSVPAPDGGLLIGTSAAICAVRRELERYAQPSYPVGLEGERGTGKNVAARWLHERSGRRGRFVRYSLAVASAREGREVGDLFGWTRGAFTGAHSDYAGPFEQAHDGTLFLNEIGLASERIQELLLHALEERVVRREGDRVDRPIDTRLVFATNVNLEAAARAGTFRADLYDRLMLFTVTIPPLRARLEDIPELSATFLVAEAARLGVPAPVLRPAELDRLMSCDWPGNVRGLENVLRRFLVDGELPELPGHPATLSVWPTVQTAVARAHGNKSAAARALGISRPTLYKRLNQEARGQISQLENSTPRSACRST